MKKAIILKFASFLAPLLFGSVALAAEPVAPAPSSDDLVGRIECTSWRRDNLEARMADARRSTPGSWTISMQLYYESMVHLDVFEENHIRPWIDPQSQSLLVKTYWPDGINAEGNLGTKCAAYRDRSFLRAPVVIGVFDLPQKIDIFKID